MGAIKTPIAIGLSIFVVVMFYAMTIGAETVAENEKEFSGTSFEHIIMVKDIENATELRVQIYYYNCARRTESPNIMIEKPSGEELNGRARLSGDGGLFCELWASSHARNFDINHSNHGNYTIRIEHEGDNIIDKVRIQQNIPHDYIVSFRRWIQDLFSNQ